MYAGRVLMGVSRKLHTKNALWVGQLRNRALEPAIGTLDLSQ
jgi:hypothetical protein